MAVIETWLTQDLQKPVSVNHLNGNLFSNNGNANRIGVILTDNVEPVTISGTVSGYAVTADGSTVPCTGTKSGNKASILIPAAAYQPGQIFITVFITDGTTVTTVAAVSSNVMRTRTNAQVDPGSAVADWTQTINAAMQSVETAAENLGGIVAVPYASITFPVPLGKYTYYNNNLYRCITPIASSESFTAAHWTQVRLGDEVSDLKSAIDEYCAHIYRNLYNPATDNIGSITNEGQIDSTNTSYKYSDFIYVGNGNTVAVATATGYSDTHGAINVAYYDANKNFLYRGNVINISFVHTMVYAEVYIRLVSYKDAIPYMVNIGNALYSYIPYGETWLDDGIKIRKLENTAVELQNAQNEIQEHSDTIETKLVYQSQNLYNPLNDQVGNITATGVIDTSNTDYKYSELIHIGNGNTVCVATANGYSGIYGAVMVILYKSDGTFIGRHNVINTTYAHTMVYEEENIRLVSYKDAFPYMVNIGDALLPYSPYGVNYTNSFDTHINDLIKRYPIEKNYIWSSLQIPDVATFTEYEGISTFSPTAAELYALYDSLVTNYPDYVSKTDLGLDQSGNYHLYSYSFVPTTVPVDGYPMTASPKPKIILGGGTHGDGEVGDKREMAVAIYYFFKNLCANWQTDSGLTYLRTGVHFEVIPLQNPWGYDNYSRKNSRGVDINRNFPNGWSAGEPGTSTYGGTEPLSEAESRLIKSFIEGNLDAICYYDIHASGSTQSQNRMIYWDMLQNYGEATNHHIVDIANDMCMKLTSKWNNENITGLQPIQHGFINSQRANGTIYDWVCKIGMPGATFEGFTNFVDSTLQDGSKTVMRLCLDEIATTLLLTVNYFKHYE